MSALRCTVGWFLAAAVAFAGCTCSKSHDSSAPSAEPQAAEVPFHGVIEEREDGQVEWMIQPDGKVRARVSTPDGKPIALADVRGSVTVSGKAVELKAEGATLTGAIPRLTADLTDVAYTLTVKGKEWKGLLQVPRGGTDDLVAEPTVTVAEGTRGPNGGGGRFALPSGTDRRHWATLHSRRNLNWATLFGAMKWATSEHPADFRAMSRRVRCARLTPRMIWCNGDPTPHRDGVAGQIGSTRNDSGKFLMFLA